MGIAAPVSGVVGAVVPVLVGTALHGLAGSAPSLRVRAGAGRRVAPDGRRRRSGEGPLRELVLPFLAGVSFGLFLVFIHRAGGSTVLWPLTAARATSMAVLAASAP